MMLDCIHSKSLRFAALVALGLGVARRSEAQSEQRGRLEGMVVDSVHARPMAGVRVVAISADARPDGRDSASTDSLGRYRMNSLPAGRYVVGFESPLLDSLEITLAPHEVTIAPAGAARLDLALPPAAKLRAAMCPGVTLPPQTGVLFGHVVDPESENPLPGVVLALSWRELGIDRNTLRPQNNARSASVTTDAKGWYRVCGVPTDTWLSLQLQHGGRTGPVLRALVGDTLGIAVRHLSFTESASQSITDSLSSGERGIPIGSLTGTAMLTGVVRGSGDAPVSSAEVGVRGTSARSRTDASGQYSLHGLPAGTQVLEVRHVGYVAAQTSVELRSGATVTSDVRLQRIVNLDSMRVVATRDRYTEFNDHRKHQTFGIFLGPEEMARQRVSYTSDIIEKLPGFRVVGSGPKAQVVSSRGASPSCARSKVHVVIDGVENLAINDAISADIAAIEAYRVGEPAPAPYDHGCGVILIWTKR
jgi:hypothetical protein